MGYLHVTAGIAYVWPLHVQAIWNYASCYIIHIQEAQLNKVPVYEVMQIEQI